METRKQLKKKRWACFVVLSLVIGGGLTACQDKAINDLSPEDSKVYITNYDRTTNFSQYKTFSLPDSVVIESNDGYRPSLGSLESRFVTNVATAMTGRGFQRVSAGQAADLGVGVIRVTNLYTGVGVDPYSYYGSYWGGGLGGYGGYYPYSPSYYTYQVSDEYWRVQIVDLKNRATTGTGTNPQPLNVLFDATIRGSDITDVQGVDTAINAIFKQSPYLRATE